MEEASSYTVLWGIYITSFVAQHTYAWKHSQYINQYEQQKYYHKGSPRIDLLASLLVDFCVVPGAAI